MVYIDLASPGGSNRGRGCATKRTDAACVNDSIDSAVLVEVAVQFVSGNEYRQRMFGKF